MKQPASACRNRLDGLEIDERAVVGNDGVQLRALLNGQVALRLNGTERIGQPDRDAIETAGPGAVAPTCLRTTFSLPVATSHSLAALPPPAARSLPSGLDG